MTEEEFSESYNCPWCGGSGHVDDCDEADKQVKVQLERLEREMDWLAIIAFDGTAGIYDSPERLVEAAREAVGEGRLTPQYKKQFAME